MNDKIIGREKEQQLLNACMESGQAEFIAIYGRRRIGKTFLVKQLYEDRFDFYMTGIFEGSLQDQLLIFNQALCQYADIYYPPVTTWYEAFIQLRQYLSGLKKQQVLVFIDELPWLDTPRSNFIKALELFWNSWGSSQDRLKLIVCGSATTWMTNKLIGDKGGLHNRITRQIYLAPFTLHETEEYLKSKKIVWNRFQIIELYMILGGTPYYLSMLQNRLTLAQNIDELFFSATGELRKEYDFLFRSLFNDSNKYKNVIELLSEKNKGMTRKEIVEALKISDGGSLTQILDNLCHCDFIRPYYAFGKKERDVIYQLVDLYTLFYLKFVKGYHGYEEHYWSLMAETPSHRAWSEYAFEQVCLHHITQIKKAIGISGVLSNVCSWTGKDETGGAQIDMIIDRRDQIINLCEMKYTDDVYEITKTYMDKMTWRKNLFRKITKTKKALHLTMITTYGLKQNAYSGLIQSEVRMDDLFT